MMGTEINKGLIIVRGNLKHAYHNFMEKLYGIIDYVHPSSLDGTYIEPQITVPSLVMEKFAKTDHAAELAKKFTKGYPVELFFKDESMLVLRSDPKIARQIEKQVNGFNQLYNTSLEVEVREPVVDENPTEMDSKREELNSFSNVTT